MHVLQSLTLFRLLLFSLYLTAMFHMVKEDAEYEGYFIPKNTYMISNLWGMHHDERIFPKPFEYQPERFINDAGEFVKSKYVTPYGIGKQLEQWHNQASDSGIVPVAPPPPHTPLKL